jgi:hypothetical protein
MSARPRAQHAETVLGVVVGYSLDEACQHFPAIRLRTHGIIAFRDSSLASFCLSGADAERRPFVAPLV